MFSIILQTIFMKSEELQDAIITYLNAPETEYAIMINGEWGSGKTYFWKNVISPELTNELTNLDKTSVYITLYGLNTVDEIEQRILANLLNPSNSNSKNKLDSSPRLADLLAEIPKYFANIFNSIGEGNKIDFKGSNFKPLIDLSSTLVKDFILNNRLFKCSEKYVLCFDDLERANIDRASIFGYINKFVEHHHIKTVLISNEDEFCKEDKDYYKRTKEKLVGYTFNIDPSLEQIIEQFIQGYNDCFKQIIIDNKNIIITLGESNGNKNLRILKNCLSIANQVFQELKNIEHSVGSLNGEIIRFIFAVNLEVKTGKADLEKLSQLVTEGYNYITS